MAYTYDDFLTQLNASGLAGQFSEYDLATARQYPEFGISMLSLKQDYNNATTDTGRQMANYMAEQLRGSYGNYAGGGDGGSYINLGRSPSDYESRYGSVIDDTIDRMNNYGSFSYGEAPSYESRWDAQMQDILNEMVNRQPYLYNLETDPVWAAYKKQYAREGQRATADTLAQVSAMTGGMPSSYAVTAAQQAGDYYNAQMTDMIPQLYQQAYERYLNEYTMKQNDLSAVQSMEQMDYGKYQDQLSQYNTDRNLAYSQWQDQYNMLSNNLSAMQTQDQIDYGRFGDDLSWDQQNFQNYQAQQEAGRSSAAAQVEAILAAGGVPSADLVAASGLSQEYIDVMAGYYARAAAASAGSGSGGGVTAGQKDARTQVDAIIKAGGVPSAELVAASGYTQEYVNALVAAQQTGDLSYLDILNAGIKDPADAKRWANMLGIGGTATQQEQQPAANAMGSGTATAGQKNSVMNEVSRLAATGNPLGAMEQLLTATQNGILSEEELIGTANALGLGGYLSVG